MSADNDTPAFSRTIAATGARIEKMTICTPLSVRMTESLAATTQKLADLHGLERGEYVRHLILQDEKVQHDIWLARNALFSSKTAEAMNTASDSVGQE